jgi:DNA-binding NarL/FixJ family response regulator
VIRVVVIADNAFVAEMIKRGLRHASGLHVVGYVDGRRPCGAATAAADPQVVVVDEMTRPDTAMLRIREISAAVPKAKIIVLGNRSEDLWLRDVVEAGAHAAIAKTVEPMTLGLLVREICAGTVFHAFAHRASTRRGSGAHADLTKRELEILKLVAEGASNGSIARRLWVTEQTVKFHLSNVYRKFGVANRTEASHYAYVNGLTDLVQQPTTAQTNSVPFAA